MQDHPALVLNADFRPLSYFPLSTLNWQDAVTAVVKDHVAVVAEYDKVIRSPSMEMRLPSVVAMRSYVPMPSRVAFTRFNVFLRDRFRCQYCGEKFPTSQLTFEHVVPRSRGGITSWENIVAACDPCNLAKGNRTEMRPIRWPQEPTSHELMAAKRAFPPNYLHERWSVANPGGFDPLGYGLKGRSLSISRCQYGAVAKQERGGLQNRHEPARHRPAPPMLS